MALPHLRQVIDSGVGLTSLETPGHVTGRLVGFTFVSYLPYLGLILRPYSRRNLGGEAPCPCISRLGTVLRSPQALIGPNLPHLYLLNSRVLSSRSQHQPTHLRDDQNAQSLWRRSQTLCRSATERVPGVPMIRCRWTQPSSSDCEISSVRALAQMLRRLLSES